MPERARAARVDQQRADPVALRRSDRTRISAIVEGLAGRPASRPVPRHGDRGAVVGHAGRAPADQLARHLGAGPPVRGLAAPAAGAARRPCRSAPASAARCAARRPAGCSRRREDRGRRPGAARRQVRGTSATSRRLRVRDEATPAGLDDGQRSPPSTSVDVEAHRAVPAGRRCRSAARGRGASARTGRCAGTGRPPCRRSRPRPPVRGAAARRTGPCRCSTG